MLPAGAPRAIGADEPPPGIWTVTLRESVRAVEPTVEGSAWATLPDASRRMIWQFTLLPPALSPAAAMLDEVPPLIWALDRDDLGRKPVKAHARGNGLADPDRDVQITLRLRQACAAHRFGDPHLLLGRDLGLLIDLRVGLGRLIGLIGLRA